MQRKEKKPISIEPEEVTFSDVIIQQSYTSSLEITNNLATPVEIVKIFKNVNLNNVTDFAVIFNREIGSYSKKADFECWGRKLY